MLPTTIYIPLIQQIIIVILLWFLLTADGRQFHLIRKGVRHFLQHQRDGKLRHWHPKTQDDCPHCCAGFKLQVAHINHEVTPWSQGKGGAKKQSPVRLL